MPLTVAGETQAFPQNTFAPFSKAAPQSWQGKDRGIVPGVWGQLCVLAFAATGCDPTIFVGSDGPKGFCQSQGFLTRLKTKSTETQLFLYCHTISCFKRPLAAWASERARVVRVGKWAGFAGRCCATCPGQARATSIAHCGQCRVLLPNHSATAWFFTRVCKTRWPAWQCLVQKHIMHPLKPSF